MTYHRWKAVPSHDVVGKCIIAWFLRSNSGQAPVRIEQFPQIVIQNTMPIEVEHDLDLSGVVAFIELEEGRRYLLAFNKLENAETAN